MRELNQDERKIWSSVVSVFADEWTHHLNKYPGHGYEKHGYEKPCEHQKLFRRMRKEMEARIDADSPTPQFGGK